MRPPRPVVSGACDDLPLPLFVPLPKLFLPSLLPPSGNVSAVLTPTSAFPSGQTPNIPSLAKAESLASGEAPRGPSPAGHSRRATHPSALSVRLRLDVVCAQGAGPTRGQELKGLLDEASRSGGWLLGGSVLPGTTLPRLGSYCPLVTLNVSYL